MLYSSCQREEQEKCKRNSPADTKVSEEEGKGGAPGAEAPLQPVEKILGKQVVP